MKKFLYIFFIFAFNANANNACNLNLLAAMAIEGLNIEFTSCRKFNKFTLLNIKNGGQHIFTTAPPQPGESKMELTALTITRDRTGKIVACGFGDDEMDPFERTDAKHCEGMMPKGVPSPLTSPGPDETMKKYIENSTRDKSCDKLINFDSLATAIKSENWPAPVNNCKKIRKNTLDLLAKNGQLKYRIYISATSANITLMTNNDTPIMCGNLGDDLDKIFRHDECKEVETDDKARHLKLQQ